MSFTLVMITESWCSYALRPDGWEPFTFGGHWSKNEKCRTLILVGPSIGPMEGTFNVQVLDPCHSLKSFKVMNSGCYKHYIFTICTSLTGGSYPDIQWKKIEVTILDTNFRYAFPSF